MSFIFADIGVFQSFNRRLMRVTDKYTELILEENQQVKKMNQKINLWNSYKKCHISPTKSLFLIHYKI